MSICNLDHFAESYWQAQRFVLVGGCFDPLHDGHLEYFRQARRFGKVVCAVAPDAELRQKRTPLLPELTRLKVLNACGLLEHVHLAVFGIPAVIRALKPSHYVVGADWAGRIPFQSLEACVEVGAKVVFVEAREHSSTNLLADYERRRNAERLAALESFVRTQKPAEKPWEPVTDYSYEARLAVEGTHAQIICENFGGLTVLDVGCGPHAVLARVLLDSGLFPDVAGVDLQGRGTRIGGVPVGGPFDVSGPLAAEHWSGWRSGLVVCREVLEHLTVKQLATAVRNLVKLSSKYVYVTTRFTDGPHLLDVAGADTLDPTHISMLNQDLLRTLFVLEGCTRRADLEQQLDHQQKGRVLVYEVPA